jgi:aryl-alcohol dehydrogenase-like predicted oxidoreductase
VTHTDANTQHIFDSVKGSLERLQLDYIDVLQCHRFDKDTPVEETMQALHDVVKAGYVRYIGMSSCYAWQCELSIDVLPFVMLTHMFSLEDADLRSPEEAHAFHQHAEPL